LMIQKDCRVKGGRVLVLGITFKENCPDIRNSKVIDVVNELEKYNLTVDIHDPWANEAEVSHEFGKTLITDVNNLQSGYDAVVLAVSHNEFRPINVTYYAAEKSVIFDVKGFLDVDMVDGRL
jgi:UDP-N-acetyl-D-glucosamine/UDP-N-acetyl-D-galactosamine dehydrogenase